ncbi:MAG: tetratricopeptide repeat protein [Burkholderiales bacterium]
MPWRAFALLLVPIALALAPAADAAPKAKRAAAKPAGKVQAPALLPAPPIDKRAERLAWAESEATRHRAFVEKSPNDDTRVNLALIAIEASRDIERALADGDIDAAAAFRELILKRLADTRWRLNRLAGGKHGGGDFALGVMLHYGILEERNIGRACERFAAAAAKGFADAAYRHARCIDARRPDAALALYKAAADGGHAAANEHLGRRCLEARPADGACAAARLEAAAASGRPSSKSLLGWLYAQGVGKERDFARALALYREAAAAGDLAARNNLGELYETGRGVAQDGRRAVELYREAAAEGFAPALFNLGRAYAAGVGVAHDAAEARRWLRQALEAGIRPAQQVLDWLDRQPEKPQQQR